MAFANRDRPGGDEAMKWWASLAVAVWASLGVCTGSAQAQARWSVGFSVGSPGYYRPYYPYYYYRPYPVYVAPPPVVVQPAPVLQPVPVAPVPSYATPPAPETVPPPSGVRLSAAEGTAADVGHHLRMLSDADERVRADSVAQLGRLHATQAVDPLAATLAGDRSPAVRDAAARALGLIGSPRALPALNRAAQADADRDVRRSAQFASEVIQSRNSAGGPG
jgi:hypothetical protein